MKKEKLKNAFHTSEVIFLLIITCVVSAFMGSVVSFRARSTLGTATENELLAKLMEHYTYIKENYYEEIDDKILLNGAISGMVNALGDPFSSFIGEENAEDFNLSLNGNYSGIGIEIVNDDNHNIQIVGVFKNSPADKAGLKVNDIIIAIDENRLLGKDKSELTTYVKENELEQFTLTILRGEEELKMQVNKSLIEIPSVSAKMHERNGKKVGYIYFSIFSNTTQSQFKKELEKLEQQGMNALIIDVRSNAGGHLTTAVDIVSLFFDQSKVIYQIELKEKITKYYSNGKETKQYPIVVLQDSNSASASELLSAALKESYGATIIGETSYGKGTVQELRKLDGDVEYKVTTKKWLTPKGNWIHKKGVVPDIEVTLEKTYIENPTDENDNQLQEAIRYLTEQ